jgi:multiple sugar transport system permease protein
VKAEHRQGWLFVSPWVIGFLMLTAGPMVYSLYLSFTASSLLSPPQWVGLENYRRICSDPIFYRSLGNTAYYALLGVPLGMILSLGLALLLDAPVRGLGIFRTLFFLPSVTNTVALSILWLWLQSEAWAKPALVLMSLWTVGGQMIICLAALQGVPRELTEAAAMDGAGPVRRFFAVTLPMISPALLFNFIMGLVGALQVFTQAFVMTGGVQPGSEGGPNQSTLFIVLYIYKKAFQEYDMGYASALAWALFVLITACTWLAWRVSRSRVHYEGGGA